MPRSSNSVFWLAYFGSSLDEADQYDLSDCQHGSFKVATSKPHG